MAFDFDAFLADATPGSSATPAGTPGRRTLTASIAPAHAPRPMRALPSGTRELVLDSPATARAPVQAKLEVASRGTDDEAVHAAAAVGTSGSPGRLPHADAIQRSFGRHDIGGIRAFTDDHAARGASAMGALAFATGEQVAFGLGATLHTAAHEAAHVVQQRAGVHLKGGVGAAGDPYERHADAVADRVVAGQSAEDLLDEVRGGGGAPGVQRILRINGGNVLDEHHAACVAEVRGIIEGAGTAWTPEMEATLTGWLTDAANTIAAANTGVVAANLRAHGADSASWEHGMTSTAIDDASRKEASAFRQRMRMARLTTPYSTQTPKRVPGLGKLDDRHLLRLAEHDQPEEEFWMRPSEKAKTRLTNLKRKDISSKDEAHITASGEPDDPSYVVQKGAHQLGHRYRGTKGKFIKGGKHDCSYGSKKQRQGYDFKGSGLVDGHSVQVQDDQPILGPYRSDAPDWETTVPTSDGSSVTYPDAEYLPEDASDEQWIEKHPHNFYWENQEQGKHMRQKAIETPAMNAGSSFLHYNHFTGDRFQPNKGKASKELHDVPSRIDYLTTGTSGADTHYSVDNRPVADYSDPSKYDPKTHRYGNIKGAPSHTKNRTLGDKGASEHLEMAKMADTTGFPKATVLHPEAEDFRFSPPWRGDVAGYQSPPRSPYWEGGGLEQTSETVPGDQEIAQHTQRGEALVDDATFDPSTDQTTLTMRGMKESRPPDWTGGREKFAELTAATPSKTSGKTSTTDKPTAPPTTGPTLEQYQHFFATVRSALDELALALQGDVDRDQLGVVRGVLDAIAPDDPTQIGQLGGAYTFLLDWFLAHRDHLQRSRVGGGGGEAANDANGARGARLPALRQFFSECGQMAAFNALQMFGGQVPQLGDDAALGAVGPFGQDISEDAIRNLIADERPDLPVVGNLEEVEHLRDLVADHQDLQLADLHIGGAEQQGLAAINAFAAGGAVLTLIVNTNSHLPVQGHHWIAVQLQRGADGQVAILYLDSYDHDADYTDLFAAMRIRLAGVPVNGGGGVHGAPPDVSKGTPPTGGTPAKTTTDS